MGLEHAMHVSLDHPVFECPGLQHIRDQYPGLLGHHAGTMVQFLWQADLQGVAKYAIDCLGVYYNTDPGGAGHLISPRWLEEMYCSSLSLDHGDGWLCR